MKITKLILRGYKRLLLNNVHELTIDPRSPFQIILGRNGSGKSSVLEELTPLPATPADYVKGGSKTIELEGRNSKYRLTSSFKGANKHSFIKDEEELNPGGTASVQKELVKEHFRMTQDLHELLIGRTTFTEMTPAKRREWITFISDTDLTYALSVYNRLRSKLRDAQGAFKHVSSRLINETNALEVFKDSEGLADEVRCVEKELILLMEHRKGDLPAYQQVRSVMESNLSTLEQLSRRFLSLDLTNTTGFKIGSQEQLEGLVADYRREISVSESILDKTTEDYNELEKLFRQDDLVEGDSIDALKEQEKQLNSEIDELKAYCDSRCQFEISGAKEKLADTSEAVPQLSELLFEIPDNSDRRFNREALTVAEKEMETLKAEADQLVNRRSRIEHRIEHIKTAQKTKCPQCGYVWKPGVSEHELSALEKEVWELNQELTQKRGAYHDHKEYCESAREWSGYLDRFRTIVNTYPRLKPLWDKLLEAHCPAVSPKSHISTLSQWEHDLQTYRKFEHLVAEQERVRTILASTGDASSTQHLKEKFARLEKDIESLTLTVSDQKEKYRKLESYKRLMSDAYETYGRIVQVANELIKDRDNLLEIIRQETISETIGDHQSRLGQIKNKLSEKTTLEALVDDLRQSTDELGDDVEVLKELVRQLSPQEGLIAEQLTGFIGSLTDQINEIISQIWTYDLYVLPCGIESGDLDYKFPLQVDSPNTICPDIGKASEGQKEIINFAFKMVVMLYLDMMDYPLYLDELGRTFDEQHRINTVDYLKLLVDARRYSQIFYISHFACSYGAMSGADVLVMDKANIAVPANINEHAKIA